MLRKKLVDFVDDGLGKLWVILIIYDAVTCTFVKSIFSVLVTALCGAYLSLTLQKDVELSDIPLILFTPSLVISDCACGLHPKCTYIASFSNA